ncbi:MAG TPA: hypothetical protein VGJ00_08130 [Rhabdochlamydiaceae bacterium]
MATILASYTRLPPPSSEVTDTGTTVADPTAQKIDEMSRLIISPGVRTGLVSAASARWCLFNTPGDYLGHRFAHCPGVEPLQSVANNASADISIVNAFCAIAVVESDIPSAKEHLTNGNTTAATGDVLLGGIHASQAEIGFSRLVEVPAKVFNAFSANTNPVLTQVSSVTTKTSKWGFIIMFAFIAAWAGWQLGRACGFYKEYENEKAKPGNDSLTLSKFAEDYVNPAKIIDSLIPNNEPNSSFHINGQSRRNNKELPADTFENFETLVREFPELAPLKDHYPLIQRTLNDKILSMQFQSIQNRDDYKLGILLQLKDLIPTREENVEQALGSDALSGAKKTAADSVDFDACYKETRNKYFITFAIGLLGIVFSALLFTVIFELPYGYEIFLGIAVATSLSWLIWDHKCANAYKGPKGRWDNVFTVTAVVLSLLAIVGTTTYYLMNPGSSDIVFGLSIGLDALVLLKVFMVYQRSKKAEQEYLEQQERNTKAATDSSAALVAQHQLKREHQERLAKKAADTSSTPEQLPAGSLTPEQLPAGSLLDLYEEPA